MVLVIDRELIVGRILLKPLSCLLPTPFVYFILLRERLSPRPKSYLPPASRTAQIEKALVELDSYLRS